MIPVDEFTVAVVLDVEAPPAPAESPEELSIYAGVVNALESCNAQATDQWRLCWSIDAQIGDAAFANPETGGWWLSVYVEGLDSDGMVVGRQRVLGLHRSDESQFDTVGLQTVGTELPWQ